jgi:tetratricopeptide (TPR) repeat protein
MSGEVSVPAMIAGSSPKKAGQALRQAASRLKLGDARGAIAGAERAGASGDAGPGLFLLEAEAFSRAASRPGLSARERRGLFVRAEAAALKAVREDPLGAKGFKWLAWSRLSLGRYRDAVKSAGESIRLDPRDPEAHAIRAYAYERLGDRGRMLADIEEAARLDAGRFFGQALRARRNEALFDPAAEDSLQLLEGALRPGARRGLPWPAWFLLLAGGAGAVAGLLRRLRRRVQPKAGGRDQEAPEPEPGLGLLSGKYRLRRVIGKGGMGQVWEAHDEVLDRDVAIKKMALSGGELETQGRALFIEEARTLASLHHPGIVEIYEVLDLPSGIFLVFELLSGKTVAQIIAERGRLPVAAARGILRQACAALGFAHRSGVVHRDLKASNLMVTDQGFVKVVDFGIARRLSDSSPGEGALPPSAAGTPAAMAPEAASGLCSAACDVFSLGVCFYEMLTGRLPFPPDSLPGPGRKYVPALSLVPGLPPAVDAFIARALEPDPGKRLRTAEEFLAAMNSDVP